MAGPVALDVNREAVKTLVIAVGVREAARRMGIAEGTVQSWSSRFGWLRNHNATKAEFHATRTQPVATKAPDALQNALADDALHTRVGLSQAGRKVATYLGARSPETLMERDVSQSARNWTDVASKVHGWDADKREGDKIMINIGILGQ